MSTSLQVEPVLYQGGDRVVVTRRRRGEVRGTVESVVKPRDGRARYWVLLDLGCRVFVTGNGKLVRENPLKSLASCAGV